MGDPGPITTIVEDREGEAAAERGDEGAYDKKEEKERNESEEEKKKEETKPEEEHDEEEERAAGCLFCPRGGPAAGFCTVM